MEYPQELKKLFDDPLLEGAHPPIAQVTPEDRLTEHFKKIINFIDINNRMPDDKNSLEEKLLTRSLAAIRKNKTAYFLKKIDKYHLL